MNQPGVTIMICCYNGAGRLPETLKHIAMQQVPSYVPWECIIVDNKSTDQSALVARQEWSKYKVNAKFRVVLESNLGLSNARTRGFNEARYEYVVMCDDDNWLAPDYVANVYRIMFENERIGALGGNGKLLFEVKPPRYIEHANIFAAGPQGFESGKVQNNKLYGAGCVIRKSAYERLFDVGFQTLLVDRKGRQLSSGGDYELCYALAILGYDVWYDETLKFVHFITKERLNWEYFMRYAKESAACFEVLSSYSAVAENMLINKITLGHILRNAFYTFRRYVNVNAKRMITKPTSDNGRILFFRHYILSYKLKAYVIRFREMIRIHDSILAFRDRCLQEAAKQRTRASRLPVFRPSFARPFQPLQ